MGNISVLTVVAVCVLFIYFYNKFVSYTYKVKASWSDIDVQLKRRFDLLPALAEVVKGYTSYEKGTLEKITNIRSKMGANQSVSEKSSLQNDVSNIAKSLLAVAEAYPDLKANQNFIHLQQNISEVEEQIQYARRYYNGTVRDFNTMALSFPSNIVAKMFNFKQQEFFEIELATQKEPPELKLS